MQVARVGISDEQWRAFRQLALARDISVSGYLGRLVEAELKHRKAPPIEPVASDPSDLERAIAALKAVRASIDELSDIAGQLARAATARGVSWEDVARPLRLSADVAETAFGRDGG